MKRHSSDSALRTGSKGKADATMPMLPRLSVPHAGEGFVFNLSDSASVAGKGTLLLAKGQGGGRILSASTTAGTASFGAGSAVSRGATPTALQTLKFLGGLSSPASLQNDRNAAIANRTARVGSPSSPSIARSRSGMLLGSAMASSDEHEFKAEVEGLASSMEMLKIRHEAFQGKHLDMSFGARGITAVKKEDDDVEGDAKDKLKERLEAYRYHRKLEGELPPLVMNVMATDERHRQDQSFVIRNVSEHALEAWTAKGRMLQRDHNMSHMRSLMDHASRSREYLEFSRTESWSQELDRKRKQGDNAIAARRASLAKATAERETFSPGRWFELCVIASNLHALHKVLQLQKLSDAERAEVVETEPGHMKSLLQKGCAVMTAMRIGAALAEPEVAQRFNLIAVMFHTKLKIRKMRERAAIIHDCLDQWRDRGRFFVLTLVFDTKMKRVQRWWRQSAKRLHEIRNEISKTWEKLEKNEMVQPVPEEYRLNFIEHEMRYRRYMILSKVQVWEQQELDRLYEKVSREGEDALNDDEKAKLHRRLQVDQVRGWEAKLRQALQEAKQKKEAGDVPEKKEGDNFEINLEWRRPSYIPPSHPAVEGKVHICGPDCHGRRGDSEILDMVRRCHAHPRFEGWREIPTHANGGRPASPNRATRPSADAGGTPGPEESNDYPYGRPPTNEEVRVWGVGEEYMPGLNDRNLL